MRRLFVTCLLALAVTAANAETFQLLSPVPGWRSVDTGTGFSLASISMPVVLPLELRIGEYLLSQPQQTSTIPGQTLYQGNTPVLQRASATVQLSESGRFHLNVKDSAYRPVSRGDISTFNPHQSWLGYQPYRYQQAMTLAYKLHHGSLLFDLGRTRLNRSELENTEGGERVNAGLALGLELASIQKSMPLQLLLGVGSRHSVVDPFREQQLIGAEYGTVYLTPGFQITARSVVIETVLELPFHSYDLRQSSGSIDDRGYNELQDVRARFGMKYYID